MRERKIRVVPGRGTISRAEVRKTVISASRRSVTQVIADSSDALIIAAINEAGQLRLPWRKHDWPKPEDKNGNSWVIPKDIGVSKRQNRALLRRLHKMTKAGILKRRYYSSRLVIQRGEFETHRVFRGWPRFRVAR